MTVGPGGGRERDGILPCQSYTVSVPDPDSLGPDPAF